MSNLTSLNFNEILFFDIETVSGYASFGELGERMQALWAHKCISLNKSNENELNPAELYSERAAIFSEFGKIICISVGYFSEKDGTIVFRLKNIANDDERILVTDFFDLLTKTKTFRKLCGHNIREFDVPYIARRAMLLGLPLAPMFQLFGKKPWDLDEVFLDTMQLWKMGDFKSFTSLNLLTAIFDIPSPKDDISGADVGRVYWKENDLKRIAEYCGKDVVAVAQLLRKMSNLPLFDTQSTQIIN